MNIVVAYGAMAGRNALIRGITDDTTIEELIKKSGESFDLKNALISLYFPLYITVKASIRDVIECYGDVNNLSVYSLCFGGNKSVTMVVRFLDEMKFDINMKVQKLFNITLEDIKGSDSISDLIIKIKEKTGMKDNFDCLKIKGVLFNKEKKVSDIIPKDKIPEIICNIDEPKQSFY